MLPKILTDDLCLLKPGIIRLTFSVLLKIDENGKICSIWFGRSIVQLNRKFTNETAEVIISLLSLIYPFLFKNLSFRF